MAVATANICTRGVEQRVRHATLSFALIVAALVGLAWAQAPAWSIGLLFVPLLMATNLAYQGLFKVCVFMAAKGQRDLGDGQEKIACRADQHALRSRGLQVLALSFVTAAAMTGTALLAVSSR